MTDINLRNIHIIQDTITQFREEVRKSIMDPNYSKVGIIHLKNTLEDLEKEMKKQEKQINQNYQNQKNTLKDSHRMVYNPPKLPVLRQKSSRIINYTPDDNIYKLDKFINLKNTDRLRDYKHKREYYTENVFKTKRLKSAINNLNNDELFFYEENKVEKSMKVPNYMNPQKRISYSINNRRFQSNNLVFYDKNKQPIIRNKDLNKGVLNLQYKKIIPKGADLTPAFNLHGGNPFQINKKMSDYTRKGLKDEYKGFKGYKNKEKEKEKEKEKKILLKEAKGTSINPSQVNSQKSPINTNKLNTIYTNENNNNTNNTISNNTLNNSISNLKLNPHNTFITEKKFSIENSQISESQQITIEKNQKLLVFSNFEVVKDESYYKFYEINQNYWAQISYIIDNFIRLCKKLTLKYVQVYQDKILELSKDELKVIQNRDLLLCIYEKDLDDLGLNPKNPIELYATLKEKFVIKIQTSFRQYLMKKKVEEMKIYFKRLIFMQHIIRSSKLKIKARIEAKKIFEERYQQWKLMMNDFKKDWDTIKNSPRIEIHFNSISLPTTNSIYLNTTFHKFTERENNELNRIINLIDDNVEILYISPHELNPDIITYYTSILATLDIKNINERFHIIIPEAVGNFYPHYSISELLLLSPNTLNYIKNYINGKFAYIIPGNASKTELQISMLLDIPILMGDLFQSQIFFSKSGSKIVFKENKINSPISAWDIKSEFEFYSSLSHLINLYPNFNVWIFKMDYEVNGRGIAYIQLDRMESYIHLKNKKEKFKDEKKYEVELCEVLKKSLPTKVKICAYHLYKNWEEYFNNFIEFHGIIEACPVYNPLTLLGSPCLPILIEPNGDIQFFSTYDKINLLSFRTIGAISPQFSIPLFINKNETEENESSFSSSIMDNENEGIDLFKICDKIGKYLYKNDIIGFVTIELIAFQNYKEQHTYIKENNKINYWAIDLKFGLNEILSSINFCNFLYNRSAEKLKIESNNSSINSLERNLTINNTEKYAIFSFPFLSHKLISQIKLNDFIKAFRNENLIYDIETKEGIIFNFSDSLECGSFGIQGILNLEKSNEKNNFVHLWKMIQNSLHIVSIATKLNEFQPLIIDEQRTDIINLSEIFNKINKYYSNLLIKQKNDKREEEINKIK